MSDTAPFKQALGEAMAVDPRAAWEIIQAQRQMFLVEEDEVVA